MHFWSKSRKIKPRNEKKITGVFYKHRQYPLEYSIGSVTNIEFELNEFASRDHFQMGEI